VLTGLSATDYGASNVQLAPHELEWWRNRRLLRRDLLGVFIAALLLMPVAGCTQAASGRPPATGPVSTSPSLPSGSGSPTVPSKEPRVKSWVAYL
jgi:hypothetical protein